MKQSCKLRHCRMFNRFHVRKDETTRKRSTASATPVAAKRIKLVVRGTTATPKVSKSSALPPPPPPKDEDYCRVCNEGGTLLECETEGCGLTLHVSCAGLSAVPRGAWHCPRHRCVACGDELQRSSVHCATCPSRWCDACADEASRVCPTCSSDKGVKTRALRFAVAKATAAACAAPFLGPVSRKVFPEYYDIVEEPIDLGLIQERVQDGTYRTRDDFLGDVDLLVANAELFCRGRFPHIIDDARAIDSVVRTALERTDLADVALAHAETCFRRASRGLD